MTLPPSTSLSGCLRELQALRQHHQALSPIDPLIQQLDRYREHLHTGIHAVDLELSQVSSALSGLLAMLDQSNLDSLECEQVYCLLEPFARRLQQTATQVRQLI